jgi:hypothetical protein
MPQDAGLNRGALTEEVKMRSAAIVAAVVVFSGPPGVLPGHPVTAPEPSSDEAPGAHPLVGQWTANLSKSRRDANHQFESATLRFEVAGDAVTITHGGVNASGHEESGVTTLQADGEEHALPEAPGMVVVTRWVGSRALETVARKDGQRVSRGTYEVSADGRILTATVSGTDASGTDFEQVVVFDRQ